MDTVLVTGATGCLGSNLIAALTAAPGGLRVRALRREHSNLLALRGLDVELRIGDLRDEDSLRRAMRGCARVFHTAAVVSFWKRKQAEQFAINVLGTRNVVNACLAEGVGRLIHTSSVAALGYRTDGRLIDEHTAYNWGTKIGYRYTKHLAELEVLQGVARGLDAVMVNPSVVVGARDVYIHGGQIVHDISRGKVPGYIRGGMNIVGGRDVADGHIRAAERGRPGERYILAGTNLTHREAFAVAAGVVRGRAPRMRIPLAAARALAAVLECSALLTGREPPLTTDLLAGAGMFNWYTAAKAGAELGYSPSCSVEQAMREAYEWYVGNGFL